MCDNRKDELNPSVKPPRGPGTASGSVLLLGLTLTTFSALILLFSFEFRSLSRSTSARVLGFGLPIQEAGKQPAVRLTSAPDPWKLEVFPPSQAVLSAQDDPLAVDVTKVDGTDWHVQLYRVTEGVQDGKTYIMQFRAKSHTRSGVLVSASVNQGDYHSIGLQQQVALTPNWHTYRLVFDAHNVEGHHVRCPYFLVGENTGDLWLKDVTIQARL